MPGSVSIKQLSNKGTFADACRISLDYAHHMVDITGADAAAGAGIAGSRVRAGNIRISTMIDIKESSLRAFKQHVFTLAENFV